MKTIKLELNIDQTNLVLEALGALPFARVFQLVAQIQEQARPQMQSEPAPESEDKEGQEGQ